MFTREVTCVFPFQLEPALLFLPSRHSLHVDCQMIEIEGSELPCFLNTSACFELSTIDASTAVLQQESRRMVALVPPSASLAKTISSFFNATWTSLFRKAQCNVRLYKQKNDSFTASGESNTSSKYTFSRSKSSSSLSESLCSTAGSSPSSFFVRVPVQNVVWPGGKMPRKTSSTRLCSVQRQRDGWKLPWPLGRRTARSCS